MTARLSARRQAARSASYGPATDRDVTRALVRMIQPSGRIGKLVGGLRISARCVSAAPEAAVGGDWFLSMPTANGDVVLAVGDVAGHGLAAAATMIRLRFAMAAFAAEGTPPAQILSRLNSLLRGHSATETATVVVARYSAARAELSFARAGHPPILHGTARTGRVLALPNPDGPLLGPFANAQFDEQRIQLLPGDVLLMHTDGVVPRGHDVDETTHALATRLTGSLDHPARILDGIDYQCAGDDACVLVAECRS